MEPIWVSVGKKLKDGTVVPNQDLVLRTIDGNHRVTALKKLKKETVIAYIPESHYNYWRNKSNEQDS